jgi:hypothetical protein
MGEEFVRLNAKSWCIAKTSVIYGWGVKVKLLDLPHREFGERKPS